MASTTEARSRKHVFPVKPPLDTSFKKNTTVIKRFRTSLTPENTSSLLKEISTVSLEKYLPEVISAVSEGLLKVKVVGDINTAVEVVSALHQRFGKAFTPFIVWNIAKGLATPGKEQLRNLPAEQREKEESGRLARQRVLLRVATELWLVGVVRTLEDAANPEESAAAAGGSKSADSNKKQATITISKSGDDEPLPLEALKDILSRDREGVNLPLVVLFIKNFAWDVLGVKARTTSRKGGTDEGVAQSTDPEPHTNGNGAAEPEDQPLTEPSVQIRFRNILTTYFAGISKYIQNEHRRLQQQAKRNSEAYVRSGEVFEDRQQAFEKATKAQEKLVANAQIVAEALGLEMPDMSGQDEVKDSNEGMIRETGSMFKKGDDSATNGMWEDDDQRRFYEELMDLRARVPSVLLDEGRKAASGPSEKTKEEDAPKIEIPDTADEELATKTGELDLNTDTADRDTSIANKTIGAQVDALLIRLPELTNRDLIDTFAFDFCFLNSKASRNRLIKVLEDIPKGRSDLLPYYTRLIASLAKAGLTDIPNAMVAYLDKEFRNLQKRKEKEQLAAIRTQNAKYIAELTKFGLVPEHVIFHCLKVALDDFSRMNIDIICTLLEGCGRYLLRTPGTQPRMIAFLETLQRKKDAHHLGAQDRVAIENAFYYVNPPERPAIVAKERSPAELYVRKLIYLDLNKKNYNKTIKSLRKLHWEDPDIVNMLIKVCTKIWKVKYSNVFIIAILVFGLFRYHQDFGIRVVDGVLENIRVGLEENDYRMNQRRIATIKYLGELYNYKMIDSPVIFDTLYLILTFGYAFFQYYIHLKERVPMDIEFMIQDTFQLVRPNWNLHTSLEEAGKAFQEAAAKIYGPAEAADDDSSSTEDAAGSDVEDEEIKLSDDELEVDPEPIDAKETNNGALANDDDDSDSDDDSSESGDMDDGVLYTRPQEIRDPEADAEFDREFAKLMADSLESRKFERKTVFDVPLPIKKTIVAPTPVPPTTGFTMAMLEDEDEEPLPPQKPGIMTFSLLTKKGNKQQTREIELPSDSTFAVAMKTKQEAEREERQRIKDRVLHYERMEEDPDPIEDKLTMFQELQRPNVNGANLKYGDKNKGVRGKKLQLGDFNWYDRSSNQDLCNEKERTGALGSSAGGVGSSKALSQVTRQNVEKQSSGSPSRSIQQEKGLPSVQSTQISALRNQQGVPKTQVLKSTNIEDVKSVGPGEALHAANRRRAARTTGKEGVKRLAAHQNQRHPASRDFRQQANCISNRRQGNHNRGNSGGLVEKYPLTRRGNYSGRNNAGGSRNANKSSDHRNNENHQLHHGRFPSQTGAGPVKSEAVAPSPPPPLALDDGSWPELGK
ncbi:hypothetical protein ABW19_dt0209589 [Dactylella cylindrospora]|nr:hypothetical protein ABW19_dt0209589 [Dactylella cylindrospora]